jgi:hypothetical protein
LEASLGGGEREREKKRGEKGKGEERRGEGREGRREGRKSIIKMARQGYSSMVECLPSLHKVLHSIPSPVPHIHTQIYNVCALFTCCEREKGEYFSMPQ